jgi:hypothetical protein
MAGTYYRLSRNEFALYGAGGVEAGKVYDATSPFSKVFSDASFGK